MAKTQDEINELLASDLFQKGIQDKHIIINERNSIIRYNCKNQTKRRLQNPEEFVQAETYLKLIYEYNYPATNISVNESVQIGSETREADILVYNDSHNKYNPQIQISAESETKRSIFREKDKTKRSKKESAQHSKSRNKSFVMTSVSAL